MFNVDALRKLPTLATGQADSLKVESENERIWLCRCTREDGMCCDAHVTVEHLTDGKWITAYEECH